MGTTSLPLKNYFPFRYKTTAQNWKCFELRKKGTVYFITVFVKCANYKNLDFINQLIFHCAVAASFVQIDYFGVRVKATYQKVMMRKKQIDTVFKQI